MSSDHQKLKQQLGRPEHYFNRKMPRITGIEAVIFSGKFSLWRV